VPFALEGFGYCGEGDAARFFRDKGIGLDGALPVNTGGGHLSEAYMQGWNHQIEAVRQLRGDERFRRTPILVLTTESSDEMKQAGRAAGATGWMVKPFDPARLIEVIGKVLPR
jgi:CheY-like chemotaxis protein